ncbi:MAG: 50S ribosomal protein L35 [Syntrophales bacterium]|nr:50S ribosomal protein L35 [Syntrophales bacterium]
MPKLKSNRGVLKRFSVTGSGKIKRRKAFANHLLSSKSMKRKRRLRKPAIVDITNANAIKRLMPYSI